MKYTLLGITLLLLTTCEAPNVTGGDSDALSVLEETRSKMLTTPTHQYRFRSFWDNRFASSTYEESMEVTYSWLPESQQGFGYHVTGGNTDLLYDGQDELKIDHVKRKVVRVSATEIATRTDYFTSKLCFRADPKALPEVAAIDRSVDTIIGGKNQYAYFVSTEAPAKSQVSSWVYYLDPKQKVVDRIQIVSHVGRDTSQLIDYFFSDYVFSDDQHAFGASDRPGSLAYREVNRAEDKKERNSGLIRPGAQLYRADYTSIEGEEKLIYGESAQKTVVMFGFIGCSGCALAMREMKKKSFAVKKGINLFYSSPVDNATKLRTYLKQKEFPFTSFGKESLMNDNFRVAGFPTFVLIDGVGRVERVIGGYDTEVETMLFE
ncbi:thioredoxin fold domain-containing protein [Neolewinella agarilytica]|uniref:Thioredoxin-like domain-containing protein n=1 Tax=Neolewinella agarilytica TaxID=478744 RepID=A0A1H8Z4W2_9BACT|nr:thioredoxin fold domain-containing protein [Neolewinella agarilytica]SEP59505.1 Thioredoxin-like domain-containing protein [Neolewinella agarilytica]